MVLANVLLKDGPGPVDIGIRADVVFNVAANMLLPGPRIVFDNAIAFPGLINSHDHLDFNLFPQMGHQVYQNYTQWGKDIHERDKDEINKVLKVPVPLREEWGIIKNLLCGVTTVVNHGEKVKLTNPLITVYEAYQFIHSVQFEKRWKLKLNNPLKTKSPVVIHIGEGTDQLTHDEIDQLIRWNLLKKPLIGVHAVAMTAQQATKFKALVWCPQSNFFLLDNTAAVSQLSKQTTLVFGTDSTLTGNWNIWVHIAMARKSKMLTDEELYQTLQLNPSRIWQTNTTTIQPGANADLVIANKKGSGWLDSFFEIEPKDLLLVLHHGKVRLVDASLYYQLTDADFAGFTKITIDGVEKYIQGDMAGLMKNIRFYYPAAKFPISVN
ncbi:MAG: hypothetical protein ACXVAY_02720 [Mucilaginibacter sp.]